MANRTVHICMWLPSYMASTELTNMEIYILKFEGLEHIHVQCIKISSGEIKKMGSLQRQFGKDFHKFAFFVYNSTPRTHMVYKSFVLQWKSAVSKNSSKAKLLSEEYIRRGVFDNSVVVSSQ